MGRPEEPRLDRSITLHLQGDWGQYNLHRVCGWISLELVDRSGPHTRIAIWNGRGGADAVHAVGCGQVDIALITPAAFATGAPDGKGLFEGTGYPHLRALGVIAHRDRLVLAVRRSLEISSMEELRKARPALTLATAMDDRRQPPRPRGQGGTDPVGGRRGGLGRPLPGGRTPLRLLRPRQGGTGRRDHPGGDHGLRVAGTRARPDLPLAGTGRAGRTARRPGLARRRRPHRIPAGHRRDPHPGLQRLPRPHHHGSARRRRLCDRLDPRRDTGGAGTAVPAHPPDRSPVTYPLDPVAIGTTPIPLHPGAAAYYEAIPR